MDPHHYGSVHTPLPRPATIPKKGVESGCVIGLHTAGGQDTQDQQHERVQGEEGDDAKLLLSEHISKDESISSESISLPKAISRPAAPMQKKKKYLMGWYR